MVRVRVKVRVRVTVRFTVRVRVITGGIGSRGAGLGWFEVEGG